MFNNEFMKLYEELSNIDKAKQATPEISHCEGDLQEANKIVNRIANNPWYSGGFSGLNDISTRVSPEEIERKAKEEEERRLEAEERRLEAERKELELEQQKAEKKALKAIADGSILQYNFNNRYHISHYDVWPAIDLDTKELVYDKDTKEQILQDSERITRERQKEYNAKYSAARKQRLETEYTWTAHFTIGDKRYAKVEKVQGNDDPEGACERVKQKALAVLKQERHECRVFNEPFQWDGKLVITVAEPHGEDQIFKQCKFKVN
jgi:hypothetical protein